MKDGDHRKCPIVPNDVVRLRYGEEEDEYLSVSPAHDTIQMFAEPEYNYLRYYNEDNKNILVIFLADTILADLVDEKEYELYQTHIGRVAMVGIEKEEQLTDAEIEWFWKEVE